MKRESIIIPILGLLFLGILNLFGQNEILDHTNKEQLREMARRHQARFNTMKAAAIQKAKEEGWPIRQELEKGKVFELMSLDENGMPVYYETDNFDAARTISTDNVWPGGSAGLSLEGDGMTAGEWDQGGVRVTHQELTGRITQMDSPAGYSDHSTHVAGTILASGVQNDAHGMAPRASLDAYEWNDDVSEMCTAAANGLLISNHSYGQGVGWYYYGLLWAGDENISAQEDYKFGFYGELSATWDSIAYYAPYYLIMKSAGNNRGEGSNSQGHEIDGGIDGYDCIGPRGVAKNILTIGAVNDISSGYAQPSDVVMSSFSGWGPTDDGRIKPDLVANGIGVYSCISTGNTAYDTYDGTSMATPSATGSLLLLQEHYTTLSGGSPMRSATLKGLAIHTADEAGPGDGPDYQFGWGLVNMERAALLIDRVWTNQQDHTINEQSLNQGDSYSLQVNSDGAQPLRVTICWNDPPGTPVAAALDPSDIMLVNDLDLRITHNSTTYYPWNFAAPDPNSPSATATTGDNIRDNVEQVHIDNPVLGTYTITVNHKGTLTSGQQTFSLIMSGAHYSDNPLPVELTVFEAIPGNRMAVLQWETQSELSNLGFNLLRSDKKDGPYRLIATYTDQPILHGLGNSSSGQSYSYEDLDLQPGRTYWYQLEDVSVNGQKTTHGKVSVTPYSDGSITKTSIIIPNGFSLGHNFPNPFNPATSFTVEIPQTAEGAQDFNIAVFDLLGRQVKILFEGKLDAGSYRVEWDGHNSAGQDATSGMYIYQIQSGRFRQSHKMLLVR